MSRINVLSIEEAPEASKEWLEAAKKKFGKVPNILGVLAHAPAALRLYLKGSEAVTKGHLSPKQQEQVALAIAGANDCEYCASAHAYVAGIHKVSVEEIHRNLQGEASDPLTAEIVSLAKDLVENRGIVSDERLAQSKEAGVTSGQIIEIIALISLNTLTNYTNHVAGTAVDFPKIPEIKAQ